MPWQKTFTLGKRSLGCHLVTSEVMSEIREGLQKTPIGILHLHILHTSASLSLNENTRDMTMAMDTIVPESLPWRHTDEGPDDSASHTKASLMGSSITIPITNSSLALGTWQGIYLAEWRRLPHSRRIVATILPQIAMSLLLALNCGSSSFKFKVYRRKDLSVVASGSASGIGTDSAKLKYAVVGKEAKYEHPIAGESHEDVFVDVLALVQGEKEENLRITDDKEDIALISHRIVHGGTSDKPLVVTKDHQEGLKLMDELSTFAPLHNHHAVLTVKACLKHLPTAKNVKAPIPIRRYGMHGLSYSSILTNVARHLDRSETSLNIIICHLGSGASMCCIEKGKSVDTTMGLTPLEGLPGGTRSGSLDPSLVFHLFSNTEEAGQIEETKGMKVTKAELLLNKQAGFQGLCGTSDFGEITSKADQGDKQAKLAVSVFEEAIMRYLGAYLVRLRCKPDAIVFSGGIGEKSVSLRASVVERISFLGVQIDSKSNEAASSSDEEVVKISSKGDIEILRVLTDEEKVCAKYALSA
ncbi:uncharacterized protein L969DRAFT_91988 [Mixia osmundae IAM 14324]|uniref:uncharacterized protein n=1 Tax=Mixia osmundae (strain CBS 9802 / IAM 14324 / JCM 22182 / KY 12970) TaxID=764103 RepID=UPI0004A549C3|nr:uncharacterized protein L969DRAFT_91988 [Mixia osmundae IAM 14324]KEI42549.1 hypothetical protein L969DRAFT_91988 [Mixia osmundae IAM 14324]